MDEYGLSMLAVRVNSDDNLVGCTTRWNLSDDRDQNVMNAKQINEVIGMDFYKVFKPVSTWEEKVEDAMQRLANGEDPYKIFDKVRAREELTPVRLHGRWNYIEQNGELLSPGQWFDDVTNFTEEGFAKVELNYIDINGNITKETPQVTESLIRNVVRESVMNYINMDMIQ